MSVCHLSGETERGAKRRKNSVSEGSAILSGAMTPYLSKEYAKGKRSWGQHKSPSYQEHSGKKNGTRGGCRMEVLLSAPSGHQGSNGFTTRKNILSWLIETGALVQGQKLFYLHKGKRNLGHGCVTAAGVLCGCCNDVFTLSYFEEHCGSRLHRPCQNIFVDSGKSLTDLQLEVFQKGNDYVGSDVYFRTGSGKRRRSEKAKRKIEGDGSDDTCGVCGDGGTLICCDHCPSTYHLACMELQEVPKDDWYCPNCRCAICDGSQFNGDQSVFDGLTVLLCDQCEREFHVKCLYEMGFPKMDDCPQGSWFCGQSCAQIFQSLRGLVGVSNRLVSGSSGFSWTLLRSSAEDLDFKSDGVKDLMAEHNIKLSMALSVMRECFKPMIDPRSNLDLVAHVLYNRGSDVSRLNFRGFYTIILEKEDELVSVATIRVHGNVLAEMPLIGTRYQYRRRGMCRRLMYAIEQMLGRVGVELLVLPAVPELMDTWRGAFGFLPLSSHQKRELTKLNLMAFPGTSLLHKSLPRCPPNFSFEDQVQKIPQMVNVPIGGPDVPFLSSEDVKMSLERCSLQSFLMKIRDNGLEHRMLGSDFLADSPPPREVVTTRELIHNQDCGAQLDRCHENGNTPKHELGESMYSTKVVVGTTRSKRLVKTTRWVADAMNKLAGRSPPADGASHLSSLGRQITTPAILSVSNSKASNSPSDTSSMVDAHAAEPKKLILRINLSKLKEKKDKKKKRKSKYRRLSSSNREVLGAEEMNVESSHPFDSSMHDGMPPLPETRIQLEPAGGPGRSTYLELSPTIRGSSTRLETPEAEFVDIVPALDVGCHLLPILRHRARLLHSLP